MQYDCGCSLSEFGDRKRRYFLVTAHRQENVDIGNRLKGILERVRTIKRVLWEDSHYACNLEGGCIGGAGFIGSHRVEQLVAKGYDVRVLDGIISGLHIMKSPSKSICREITTI